MKTVIFAYSRQGCNTARKISECFDGSSLFAPARLRDDGITAIPSPSGAFYGERFSRADALIFVSSCGIAVRSIAPFVKSKQTDPAVLVVDELGTFVISLLSGHIGGANALAKKISEKLGAQPVITTATDIHGRFSVDAWAAERDYAIGDMKLAKEISAAVLEGDVPFCSEFPLAADLPSGLIRGESGKLGIYVGVRNRTPFENTLAIIPPVLHLGIGCRRGISAECIEHAVTRVMDENGIDSRGIKCVASIDLKAEEPGLLEYCRKKKLPVSFYTEAELKSIPGDFTPSEFVKTVTGVDNVCERAAMVGADRLLVRKQAIHGVTVAVAAENMEVSFE